MKERPILFSAPMVRALLDGSKTQTRRIVKPAPQMVTDKSIQPWEGDPTALLRLLTESKRGCPYGQPGDQLWVKEAWCAAYSLNNTKPSAIHPYSTVVYEATRPSYAEIGITGKLRPSIFMPRWASRITLEVTGVRVERLQDISEADAYAEGIEQTEFCEEAERLQPATGVPPGRYAYRALWESLNGPGSWDANPWVWVVEFRRIEQARQAA